jgi:hypothetical protein
MPALAWFQTFETFPRNDVPFRSGTRCVVSSRFPETEGCCVTECLKKKRLIQILFLDIIHRHIVISKHDVSETGFCLHLQVKRTQIRWQALALSIGPNWIVSTWRQRQNPVSETSCVLHKNRIPMDNVHVLMCIRHKILYFKNRFYLTITGRHIGHITFTIFWDVAMCGPVIRRRFGGLYFLHLQGRIQAKQRVRSRK